MNLASRLQANHHLWQVWLRLQEMYENVADANATMHDNVGVV